MANTIEINSEDKDFFAIILYEFDMLKYASLRISQVGVNNLDSNLFLESFLIHTRNLIDFLEGNKKRPDDLTVLDFKDINGEEIKKIDLNLDLNLKIIIHKHCLHLSTNRLKYKHKWKFKEIENSIEGGMNVFLSKIKT